GLLPGSACTAQSPLLRLDLVRGIPLGRCRRQTLRVRLATTFTEPGPSALLTIDLGERPVAFITPRGRGSIRPSHRPHTPDFFHPGRRDCHTSSSRARSPALVQNGYALDHD
ncbi:hypothetical protein F442_18315, partial [Phytophthora nicotianae P10297]